MNKYFYYGLLMALPLQSCINGDYDLSDVNTDVMVPVENLSVNVNMSDITLHTVLDIEEDGLIKEIDGKYAVVVEGEFETEKITVDKFNMTGAEIDKIESKTKKSQAGKANLPQKTISTGELENLLATYMLPNEKTKVSVNAKDISDAIKSLKNLNLNTKISTKINLDKANALKDILDSVRVRNLVFKIPRGFEGTLKVIDKSGHAIVADELDSKSGIAIFDSEDIVSPDGTLDLEFDVTGINEDVLNETIDQINKYKDFTLEDEYGVEEGAIAVTERDFSDNYNDRSNKEKYDALPDELEYESEQEMNDVAIEDFSGELDYKVKEFDIDPIGLEDLPDVLSQTGTYLEFTNPQIYLEINNPIKDGNDKVITAQTDLEIASIDEKGGESKYKLDEGELLTADEEINTFYLSPFKVADEEKYGDYTDAEHIGFSSLGKVLTGGSSEQSLGIPKKLIVKATDTKVVSDHVDHFKLGTEYDAIEGKYIFYAPLSLTEGSRIKYSDTIDGWNDDTIDDILISRLIVTCNATTDIPFGIQLKATPIDKYGKRMNVSGSTEVKANAQGENIELILDGDIQFLDGVVLDATASAASSETLRPNMTIKLANIKATVTGKYQSKL